MSTASLDPGTPTASASPASRREWLAGAAAMLPVTIGYLSFALLIGVMVARSALRLTPLLLGAGVRISPTAEVALRDAAAGGITALVVAATVSRSSAPTGPGTLAVVVAILVAGWVARSGRSMTVVVLAGAATPVLAIAALALV